MEQGETLDIFPTPIYIGQMSKKTHDATVKKIKDMEWGKVPLTNKAHDMNVSKKSVSYTHLTLPTNREV